MTADAINDLALSLSEVTRYEDDAIVEAQALLLTFTKVGKDVFPQATKSILNMATAMKMDLKGATVMVGKALNDPILGITAMSRAGIQFSEDQKEMIKGLVEMGDVAGAQAMILAELETQFGGSAMAAGRTLAGQMDILKNGIGAMTDEIGFALIPVLKGLATWIGPRLISGFQRLSTTIVTTVTGVRSFFTAIGTGMREGWEFRDYLAEIVREFPGMPAILQDAAAGVASFVSAFTLEEGNFFDKIKAGFEAVDWATIGATIKAGAVGIWDGIVEAVANIDWAKVATDIETFANEALTGLKIAWDKVDWEKIQADLTVYWTKTLQPALHDAWRQLEVETATDPELAEDIGTGLARTVNAAIAWFNENPDEIDTLETGNIFTRTFTAQEVLDALITPEERASLKRTWDAFIAELNRNPDTAAWMQRVTADFDGLVTSIRTTITWRQLLGTEFGMAVSHPFSAIAAAVQGVVGAIDAAIAAYGRFRDAMGGGGGGGGGGTPHGSMYAPQYFPIPVAPSMPRSPSTPAATSSGPAFNININAPGGNPQAVAAAAQSGVLAAGRSMGWA
jgi:hypothetical protein